MIYKSLKSTCAIHQKYIDDMSRAGLGGDETVTRARQVVRAIKNRIRVYRVQDALRHQGKRLNAVPKRVRRGVTKIPKAF